MFPQFSLCGLDQNLTPGYKAEAKRDCTGFLETASLVLLKLRRNSPIFAQLDSMAVSRTAKLFQAVSVPCQTQIIKSGGEHVGCIHHLPFFSLSVAF